MKFYNVNKKFVLIILLIISTITIIGITKVFLNKQKELPEVKLKEKKEIRNKSLAIMISKDNGETYEEYKSEDNNWPDSSYEYKYAKCIDNKGNVIDNNIEFNSETRQVSLETNKTIYCTLYFDKYNYMKIPLNNSVPVYMSSDIKNVYFVNYIDTSKSLNTWDLSDTENGTEPNSVMAWTEIIDGDITHKNLYIGSKAKIRAKSLASAFQIADKNNTSLEYIDFNNLLDTSDTNNMNYLFANESNLTKIKDIENWDVSNVTTMRFILLYCEKITNLNFLKNWNTKSLIDLESAFNTCSNLTDVSGIANWDVSKVTNLAGMFWDCQLLESIDLNNWNTESLIVSENMFVRNYKLKSVNIKDWNTKKLKNTGGMFHGCTSLTSIDLSGWETPLIEKIVTMFYNCNNLKTLDMRKFTFTNILKEDTTNYNILFFGVPNLNLIVKDDAQKQWIQDTASATQFKGTIQIAN